MAVPPSEDELEETDERSERYPSQLDLTLTNNAQIVPLHGKGPTLFGMIGKSFGAIMNVVDLAFDLYMLYLFFSFDQNKCIHDVRPNPTGEYREAEEINLNYTAYAYITLFIMLCSSFIMSAWSFYIFWAENKSKILSEEPDSQPGDHGIKPAPHCGPTSSSFYRSPWTILIPAFAIIVRSVRVIYFGRRYRKSTKENEKVFYWQKWVAETQDLNLIQVLESTLEQFPQLVLLIYVVRIEIAQGCDVHWFQWIKILASGVALSMSVGLMKDSQDLKLNDDSYEMPNCKFVFVVTMIWQWCTIIVRAYLLAHMVILSPVVMLLAFLLHWATFWLLVQIWRVNYLDGLKSLTESKRPKTVAIVKFIFDWLVALVLTVTWVNFYDNKEEPDATTRRKAYRSMKFLGSPGHPRPTKRRMIIYYVIITLQNATMYFLWYFYGQRDGATNWHAPLEMDGHKRYVDTNLMTNYLIPVLYTLGIIAMIVYYSICHPKRFRSNVGQTDSDEDKELVPVNNP